MKPMILLLAATVLGGAAPPRPAAPYQAGGFEPSWELEIDRGRLTFNPGTTEPAIRIPVPRRQAVRNGYRYVSPRLIVDVRHERCGSYGWRTFADTVLVTVYGRTNDGCGGRAIAPAALRYTSWTVTSIDGTPLGDHSFNFMFQGEGRATGHVGCSDFSVPYREQRPLLRFGPMRVTRRDCPGLGSALESRALRILSGTVRMRFFDGDSLLLTGSGGSLRMRP